MWEKTIYIAKRKEYAEDDFGNEKSEYYAPTLYRFNYQPVSGYTDFLEYGENAKNVYRTFVPKNIYQGQIHVGDRVYLSDGDILESELANVVKDEDKYCKHANYVVKVVLPQNFLLRIDFMKR